MKKKQSLIFNSHLCTQIQMKFQWIYILTPLLMTYCKLDNQQHKRILLGKLCINKTIKIVETPNKNFPWTFTYL